MLEVLRQSLWQMAALIVLACLIAVGVNHWRSDRIPLVGDWSTDARFADADGDSLVIDLEHAEGLFRQDKALFLDARPEIQYTRGLIRGALSIPWEEVDRRFAENADLLEGNKTIITYCDGESCDLSHDLALFLKEMGFKNVRILVNGWTLWQEAGLPTEREESADKRG